MNDNVLIKGRRVNMEKPIRHVARAMESQSIRVRTELRKTETDK